MRKSAIDVIKEKYPKLSKSHRRLADYCMAHYDQAAYLTASRLGSAVGVSEPTVVRFASRLGYDGYPELQRELCEYAKTRLTSIQRINVSTHLASDGESEMLSRVMTLDAESVRQTLRGIDPQQFAHVVDAILKARTIYIIGARSAYALASFLDCNLSIIFPSVRLVNDRTASGVFEQLVAVGPEDVVFGISFPRYAQSTAKALSFAHRRGATVISLTDADHSPLVPFSTYALYARSDIISYYDSLVAPLSVINAILAEISLRRKDEVAKVLEGVEEIYRENEIYGN